MSTNTVAQFRSDFPEFGDATAYPDTRVQFYLNLAEIRLDPVRWDALWAYGVELYVAHNLALAQQRTVTAVNGAPPGATQGLVGSQSVGGVSMSMEYGSVTTEGAGTYNLTSYGSEFYQLMRTVGIGGLQVGADALSGAYGAYSAQTFGGFGYGAPFVC